MQRLINFKNFARLYRMNRLWGDNILEASYYSLRGKAFMTPYRGTLLDKQIITKPKIDDSRPI